MEIRRNLLVNKALLNNDDTGVLNKIRELGKLRDEGLITEEEFQESKIKLLNNI